MPEATTEAYSNAVITAADVVKLDLQCTKDGVVVLGHDRNLSRNMGWDAKVSDLTYDEIRSKGRYLKEAFTGAEGIEAVSGMGLMIGLKTVKPAAQVVQECMERGVLCLTAKDKVRLLPALNIPMSVLQKAVAVITDVCAGRA